MDALLLLYTEQQGCTHTKMYTNIQSTGSTGEF